MGIKAVLHEVGTPISSWPAAACVLHRETGEVIPPPHDYSVNGCKGAAPSNPAEQRFQIRPSMVGTVPPVMERHRNDVSGGEVWLCGHSHLGRIWVMGVLSLCVIWRMVPAKVARQLARMAHYCERTAAGGSEHSHLGPHVERWGSTVSL